ncbi:MAG TPA: hypothetical protein VHE55_09080 [Fimbriimonadaceae bacterium]|nr:hypothetical protein [Fimbriimonadaceae bacterium]
MDRFLEANPLESAMPELLPKKAQSPMSLLDEALAELRPYPELQAALWLYIDDLERSHAISQGIAGPVGAYWHGIMHRREGDFWNSKYWFRQAQTIDLAIPGYDPSAFVDQVEAAGGANPPDLVEMQRKEWIALFNYCVEAR